MRSSGYISSKRTDTNAEGILWIDSFLCGDDNGLKRDTAVFGCLELEENSNCRKWEERMILELPEKEMKESQRIVDFKISGTLET